jgi:hypothetical protein
MWQIIISQLVSLDLSTHVHLHIFSNLHDSKVQVVTSLKKSFPTPSNISHNFAKHSNGVE